MPCQDKLQSRLRLDSYTGHRSNEPPDQANSRGDQGGVATNMQGQAKSSGNYRYRSHSKENCLSYGACRHPGIANYRPCKCPLPLSLPPSTGAVSIGVILPTRARGKVKVSSSSPCTCGQARARPPSGLGLTRSERGCMHSKKYHVPITIAIVIWDAAIVSCVPRIRLNPLVLLPALCLAFRIAYSMY